MAEPDRPVTALDLLGPGEREQVLRFGTGAERPDPTGTLADPVAAYARSHPDAPAVVAGHKTLTYRELDRRADRLAHHLRRLGAGPGALVGVRLEQSADLAVALLGVLKAGAGYVPLDPEQPAARLQHMLDDARPAVVLRELPDLGGLPDGPARGRRRAGRPRLRDLHLRLDRPPEGRRGRPPAAAQATSTASGRQLGIVPGAPVALLQSLVSFDFSVTAFYLALSTGGCVHLIPRRGTGAELAGYLREHRIDYLKLTPSHLAALPPTPRTAPCCRPGR